MSLIIKNRIPKNCVSIFSITIAAIFILLSNAYSMGNGVKLRVETDKKILNAQDSQTAVVKVTLDAPAASAKKERPPVNLSIVLDRSGSMTGSKIERAKEAAIEALKRLGSKDIFSLVVYDTSVNTIIPAQKGGYSEYIEGRIRAITPGGSTALFGGVSQGAAEVRKNLEGNYIHRIILLSDGLANVGPNTPADLGRLGAALIKENISVTTIGVGTDYNEDLMTKLSQKSDGNTYFVESEVDLPRIFTAELGDALNVVAKKVVVTIDVPSGVKPLSIVGREGRIDGQRVKVSMNQLYGDQEKYILIEVKVPKSKHGSKLEIASAKVDYIDAYSNKKEVAKNKGLVRFSKDKKEVKASENIAVIKEYQLNMNALAEERAISFSDKGNKKKAVETLIDSAKKLKSFAKTYNDDELLQEAEQVEKQAVKIEQDGMSKTMRKVLRTKSYQKKNQQNNF